jgi:hypothetical protein
MHNPNAGPNRESQRDSATKPRVARNELPWVDRPLAFINRNAVAPLLDETAFRKLEATP